MEATRGERMSRGINPLGDTSAVANQREFSHFRIDASGVVLDYHSSLDRRPARSPADVIGRHVSDVLPEEFATPILSGIAECLDAQSVVDVDYTLQLENGEIRYRQARLAPSGVDEVIGIVCDNTKYRVADARLNHLAEILETSSDYIATTDTAGRLRYANRAFRERFGAGTIEEIITDAPSLFDFFAESSRAEFVRDGVPALWEHGRWSGEIEVIDVNGVAIPMSQSAIAHCDVDGRARLFSGIARDITENKAAQDALFESNERFHALLSLGNDAILVLTMEGKVLYASPAVERISGHNPADLIGMAIFDLIHPDDLDRALAGFADAFLGDNADRGLQHRVRHSDGTWRWVESYTTNHIQTPGVSGFIVNARDITARKHASEQIEQASALLASVMGAAADDAIFVTDESSTIVAFSRGAEVLFGYSAAQAVGHLHPRAFHPDEQIAQAAAAIGVDEDDLFHYAPPGGQSMVRELTFVRRDGTRFLGSLTVTPRFDSHGALCGFLYVARDITEQRRVEAELTERAHHDTLTGLGNRAKLTAVFQSVLADSTPASSRTVLFIDLDRFKNVNDTYGHAIGDEVLRGTAHRLNGCLRADDVAIRLGGDEFVVVLNPQITESAAAGVAERIIEAIARPFPIGAHLICIGASVGLATSTSHSTIDELLLRADQAAYAAKHAGRGRVVVAPADAVDALGWSVRSTPIRIADPVER